MGTWLDGAFGFGLETRPPVCAMLASPLARVSKDVCAAPTSPTRVRGVAAACDGRVPELPLQRFPSDRALMRATLAPRSQGAACEDGGRKVRGAWLCEAGSGLMVVGVLTHHLATGLRAPEPQQTREHGASVRTRHTALAPCTSSSLCALLDPSFRTLPPASWPPQTAPCSSSSSSSRARAQAARRLAW